MPYRASITQVRFRLRKHILQQLKQAALRHDRSLNDEVQRRLERSLEVDSEGERWTQPTA